MTLFGATFRDETDCTLPFLVFGSLHQWTARLSLESPSRRASNILGWAFLRIVLTLLTLRAHTPRREKSLHAHQYVSFGNFVPTRYTYHRLHVGERLSWALARGQSQANWLKAFLLVALGDE